ncbi:alpha/beta fold hydrolase [Jiangella gansuensis]|uniref:alpha/beta fold hydrolase n=1 Tax=Jiangella gansuensis TaxID=281473 RepID=UPI0004ACD2FB|nr:alpha/beta hydrolase [Jiangella gansuensis]
MTHLRIADGVELAHRRWGGPGDTPVVLLHGAGGDASTWDDVGPALAAAGRLVHAYDARGHGASARTPAYSFELMRDDLLGVLDALDLERADVVGHSMGGVVGYLCAATHPDRVRRLVLEETPPPWPRPDVAVGSRPDGDLPYDWAALTAIRSQVRTPDPSWPSLLPSITTPTLVIAGGPQSQVPQDRIARMAALIPSATLVTIDAGHRAHATRPADFRTTVEAFLAA